MACEIIIEALKKGREVRPIQTSGYLFPQPGEACALGAIAIGFGYEVPDDFASLDADDDSGRSFTDEDSIEHNAYYFLEEKFNTLGLNGDAVTKRIYSINDDGPYAKEGELKYDDAVIKYLEELECSND